MYPWLAEEKMRPMPIAIEREPSPCWPVVLHSPQHCQAAHLIEPITGINERSSARLSFLSEELKGSQCPLSPPTLFIFLFLAPPLLLDLHPQCCREPFRHLLLGSYRLYA